MRTLVTIFLLMLAMIFVMAGGRNYLDNKEEAESEDSTISVNPQDTVGPVARHDSLTLLDTITLDTTGRDAMDREQWLQDSIRQAINRRNKAIDDSIAADSINRSKKNGIDAPVAYSSEDSMIYIAGSKKAFLYGNSNVKYENMDLTAEKINMQLDSSLVRATGGMDTVKKEKFGLPVFVQGGDKYETIPCRLTSRQRRVSSSMPTRNRRTVSLCQSARSVTAREISTFSTDDTPPAMTPILISIWLSHAPRCAPERMWCSDLHIW